MVVCRRCRIGGRVQMVGFRAFAQYEATERGLQGWVRNCRDGSVEVLVEGAQPEVDDFLSALRRGPAAAIVDTFELTEAESDGGLGPFRSVG